MSPFGRSPTGARLERMESSPRFSGGTFHNPSGATAGLKPGTALSTMGRSTSVSMPGTSRRRRSSPWHPGAMCSS